MEILELKLKYICEECNKKNNVKVPYPESDPISLICKYCGDEELWYEQSILSSRVFEWRN